MRCRVLRVPAIAFVAMLLALSYVSVAHAAPIIADSYSGSNQGTGITVNQNYPALSQTFTAIAGTLDSAVLSLQSLGPFPGTIHAEVYAVTGTFGTDAVPAGTPLAVSAPLTPSSTDGAYDPFAFTFDNTVSLNAGEHYAIVLRSTGAPVDSGLSWGMEWNSPFPGNHAAFYAPGDYWNSNNLGSPDFIFAVYETPSAPVVTSTPASSPWSLGLLALIGVAGLVWVRRRVVATA